MPARPRIGPSERGEASRHAIGKATLSGRPVVSKWITAVASVVEEELAAPVEPAPRRVGMFGIAPVEVVLRAGRDLIGDHDGAGSRRACRQCLGLDNEMASRAMTRAVHVWAPTVT